jgi:hypothetical protein
VSRVAKAALPETHDGLVRIIGLTKS